MRRVHIAMLGWSLVLVGCHTPDKRPLIVILVTSQDNPFLLVSVAKILLMDVWALAPPDRYVTLIVLGTALLAVSFLYTRFSEKIRKYL
jgi:hypothetical protein